jgi:arsenate reductase
MTAHWGIEDPASVEGPGQRAAFELALRRMEGRIRALLELPLDGESGALKRRLREIGRMDDADLV